VESKYVAGVHDQINEEWNKVNQQYQAAQEELHSAEAALQGAEAKGNKKQIQDTAKQAAQARKSVDDLRSKLDSTPKSTTTDIIHPYRYRKTIYNVLNHIVLQFRIDDSLSGQKGDPEQISKEEKQQFVVLNDVSPSDINAVHAQGTIPDKAELQEELENVAREELIRRLQQRVNALPRKLYDDATKREQDGYLEDAGEAYLRYLNVAPAEQVPEREHAEKFLHDKFNFLILPTTVTEPQRSIPPLVQGMATSPK
jgi:Skp family chaperone for outer membrane proteins